MKKILSVLLLAAMVLTVASCGTEEPTTTDATTTVATTTKGGPVVTPAETLPEEPGQNVEPETPYLRGNADTTKDLDTLLTGLTNNADKIDVTYNKEDPASSSLWTIGFGTWNEEKENIPQMFDGIKTEEDFTAAGQGKIGGTTSANACYLFNATEKISCKAYVITSGNDNATYTERNPVAWYLLATNDKAAADAMRAEGADYTVLQNEDGTFKSEWTILDYVYDGGMAAVNFEENGYDIDADKEGEFQYFCWMIEYTGGGSFQICELEIYG